MMPETDETELLGYKSPLGDDRISIAIKAHPDDVTYFMSVLREGDDWVFVDRKGKPAPEWYCVDIPLKRLAAMVALFTGKSLH